MFSGSRRLIAAAAFTAVLVVLVNLAWWLYYDRTEGLLEDQLSRRLASIAQYTSVHLTPEDVSGLLVNDINAYVRAIEALDATRSTDSLSEVFVLDENYRYLASTLLEPDSVYFLQTLNGPYIDSAIFGGADVVVAPTYVSGDIYLRSAFAPLRGIEGYPVAVLGVEASVDYSDSLSELRWNLYLATGISLAGGILLGLLFVLLQRRFNAAEQQLFLAQTNVHLGRMVAVVAHELKNPLMIIRASSERIARKTDIPEADYVLEEVDRLNGIVSGYLDFARSGGGLLANDQIQTIDLAELVGSLKEHLMKRPEGINIEWLGDNPNPVPISGYRRSIRQVLLNLLLNAVEACQAAGKPIKVGVELASKGKMVQIKVIDHGPGISRRDLKQLFSPFHTTKQKGSGLGLYLSRKIALEMGGELKVTSEPGGGTTVYLIVPNSMET